jgi:hypothetical protein
VEIPIPITHLLELTNLVELAKMWRCVRERTCGARNWQRVKARTWVPDAMSTQRAHYEPFAWWLTRERIGQDLRERYPALQELPSRLLALVEKLDASQGNQSLQEMPSAWLSKLDALEGDQLLRACKKHLKVRTRRHKPV